MEAKITIYFNPSCPYCHLAMEFLTSELPDVAVDAIELNGGGANHEKFSAALNQCSLDTRGIPLIIVNGQCFQGFDDNIGKQIKRAIKKSI